MAPTVFEPIISESEPPQTHALDRAATVIRTCNITITNFKLGEAVERCLSWNKNRESAETSHIKLNKYTRSTNREWNLGPLENAICGSAKQTALNFEPSPTKNK